MSIKNYNTGNLPKIWRVMVKLHKENPEAFESVKVLREYTEGKIKNISDKKHCPNCGASMASYWFKLDATDALMLIAMGKVAKQQYEGGLTFDRANIVHVQSMETATYTMKSRTSKMAQLGLIEKVIEKGHQLNGCWRITHKGLEALSGKPTRLKVEVFRNRIIHEDAETVTLEKVIIENEGTKDFHGDSLILYGYKRNKVWFTIASMKRGDLL